VDYALSELCRFFAAAKRHAEPLVLATILRTEGSTYRKAGARVLINPDGKMSGLLSGGCLENELRARASRVLAQRRPERVWLDTRGADDPLWGAQLGCEGAIDVWLERCAPEDGYPLLSYLAQCLAEETPGSIATVVGGAALDTELGRSASHEVPRQLIMRVGAHRRHEGVAHRQQCPALRLVQCSVGDGHSSPILEPRVVDQPSREAACTQPEWQLRARAHGGRSTASRCPPRPD